MLDALTFSIISVISLLSAFFPPTDLLVATLRIPFFFSFLVLTTYATLEILTLADNRIYHSIWTFQPLSFFFFGWSRYIDRQSSSNQWIPVVCVIFFISHLYLFCLEVLFDWQLFLSMSTFLLSFPKMCLSGAGDQEKRFFFFFLHWMVWLVHFLLFFFPSPL